MAKLFGYLCRMRGLVEFQGLDFRICARKREGEEGVVVPLVSPTMISYCVEDGSFFRIEISDDKRLAFFCMFFFLKGGGWFFFLEREGHGISIYWIL